MHISDKDAFEMITTLSIPSIIMLAVYIVTNLSLTLAVYYYNKSRGVKAKAIIYPVIFVFGPVVALIYYLVTRRDGNIASIDEHRIRKFKITSIILAVIFAAGFITDIAVVNSGVLFNNDYLETVSRFANFSYYDRYGNEYEFQEDVVYYTEDGCKFKLRTYDNGSTEFSQLSDTYSNKYKESYDPEFVYIDKNGYVVFIEKYLEMDDDRFDSGTPFYLVDDNGDYYADFCNVYWNADGEIDGAAEALN